MAVAEAALRNATRRNDELVNADLVRKWLAWGLGWLLLFPTIGVIISTKFNYPEFLGDTAWLTFGRLRPIHVNGVIWGAFSTLFIGLCHYLVPRLCGVRLWKERWSYGLLWVWNLNLAVAAVLLGARVEPGLGGGRDPAGQRDRHLPRPRPAHRAVPDDHPAPRGAAALRVPLVPDRGLRVDGREPRPAHAGAVPHPGHQQCGLARPVHPLRGRALDHPRRLRPHLLLPARQRENPHLQPQALADRVLVARLLLPVRRHPSLPLLADRRLGGDDRHHLVDDADHPGVDRPPELLRDHDRALAEFPPTSRPSS